MNCINLAFFCNSEALKTCKFTNLPNSEKINSKKAYDYGLVDEIVSEDNLFSRVDELCLGVSNSKNDQAKAVKKMIP